MIKEYYPTPTGQLFHKSDATIRAVKGPIGSGKSVMCTVEILRRACQQKPDSNGIRRTRCAVVRNTYAQLRDTTFKTFTDWYPIGAAGHFVDRTFTFTLGVDKNMRPGLITLPDKTSVVCEVLFRALDRPEQARNLLSLELTFAWINEYREVPFEILLPLFSRTKRYPSKQDGGPTWHGVWMDSNPPDVESPWYRFFEETTDEKIKKLNAEFKTNIKKPQIWHQPSGLSPHAENLNNLEGGVQYYVELAANAKDKNWVDVHVHGKYGFVADGRPVYGDMFNQRHHIAPAPIKPIPGRAIGIGLDFGLTPSAVITQFSPSGRWYILSELIATEMGAVQFVKELRRHIEEKYRGLPYFCYGDPSGSFRSQVDLRSVFDVFAANGFPVIASEKSVETRIDSVREALRRFPDGESGFIIDPSCSMLIRGFQGGYRFRKLRTSDGRYSEEPEKNQYSHVHDALQYIIAPFETPVMRGGFMPGWGAGIIGNNTPIRHIQKTDFNIWNL